MASSVFAKGECGADQAFNGAFCADNVKLKFGTAEAKEGAMVQSAQWQCQRSINMLYEIGSAKTYYVGNRRQGTAQCTRVVTGSGVFKQLLTDYGDICNPKPITIDGSTAACGGNVAAGGVSYTLQDATLSSVGGSVTAQDVVINEQLGFMFVDLYVN